MATRTKNSNPFKKMSLEDLNKLYEEMRETQNALGREIYRRMELGERKTFQTGKNKRNKGFGFIANEK